MEKVYIIEEIHGSYEDKFMRPYMGYMDKEKAQKKCDELNDYWRRVENTYSSNKMDQADLKEKVFKEHLKETNKELFNEVEKACEYSSSESYSPDKDNFDWDKFYDKLDEFCEDFEEFIDFAKTLCNKKEVEFLNAAHLLEPFFYEAPYYYVSYQPIEIII